MPKMKQFLYARKSSESEDRQVQSIDDQVNRMKEIANDLEIEIVEILTESKSAKKPNNRPVFTSMIERIEKGEAEGILCWQLNRLTRNPIDSGKLSWLLQQGILKSIQTIDRQYLPDDNVLVFNVDAGSANQFILDLRKNTLRGLKGRAERGWMPNMACLGYKNDKEEKTIIPDPERYDLVKKMWDLMLTGNYSVSKIDTIANKDWGFRTRKFKRIGGKELSKSGLYRIFTNPFYAGIVKYGGKEYVGKHKAMITMEEFNRVQTLLGSKGKPRPKSWEFPFTGMIRCEECGCLYTAETKTKYIKSSGKIKSYTYYHCTRKKKDINCSQRKVLTEKDLENQIEEEIQKITIIPEFRDWALEVLRGANDQEIETRAKASESLQKALNQTQSQLDNLTKMRYRDLISDDEFTKERSLLQKEINEMRLKQKEVEQRTDSWLNLTEKTFHFATNAKATFEQGDLQTKKEVLAALGSNPTIKDGKLSIPLNEWLVPIAESYPALEKEYQRLEPTKESTSKGKNEAIASLRSTWLGGWGSNPRPIGYTCLGVSSKGGLYHDPPPSCRATDVNAEHLCAEGPGGFPSALQIDTRFKYGLPS